MVDVTEIKEDPLEKEGWTKRSILDEPRLSEAVELYRSLGFEVRLEPVRPGNMKGCTSCLEYGTENYKVVYTRPGEAAEDLF